MSRSSDLSARMMIKVSLKDKSKAEFELVMIDTKQLLTKSDNYYYFSHKNEFMIHFTIFGFSICKYNYILNIPINFIRRKEQICKLEFKDNDERYTFIKGIKNLLIDWSNSSEWDNGNHDEINKISFNDVIWIMF